MKTAGHRSSCYTSVYPIIAEKEGWAKELSGAQADKCSTPSSPKTSTWYLPPSLPELVPGDRADLAPCNPFTYLAQAEVDKTHDHEA